MKGCELCKGKARMHCESDQASLCWDCDAKVHSANFLVARHSRDLLCYVCQSPTSWSASGAKLGPTVSVCEQCINGRRDDESGTEDEEAEEAEEIVEENQVVPWSPPPPTESSSSSEESVSDCEVVVSRKRCRPENASSNRPSDERQGCSWSQLNIRTPPSDSSAGVTDSLLSRKQTTPLQKIQRTNSSRVEVCGSRILDSLRRLHREETGSGGEMTEFCSFQGPTSL